MLGYACFRCCRKVVILTVVAGAVALAIGVLGYRAYHSAIRAYEDWYAVSLATDMLLFHIAGGGGVAADNWENLREAYEYNGPAYGIPFARLREEVIIDFDALAAEMSSATRENGIQGKMPDIITLRDRSGAVAVETEANRRIRLAIQERDN